MTKFLIKLIALAVVVYLIARDTWRVTLNTSTYEISVSFVLFLAVLVLLWWILVQIKKPFSWWSQFRTWRQNKKRTQKDKFLPELLTAILSHRNDETNTLMDQAAKLYGKGSKEALLISALLEPQTDIFKKLNQVDQTKLAGLYGLIKEAEAKGDFEEMTSLLQQVPKAQEKTLWVQQAKMMLALNHSDWKQALDLLEQNKKQLSRADYKSHKACLLLKLGRAKEAYALMPDHPAIVLAYAKTLPFQKAQKALEKAWHIAPNWQIYLAYKQSIKQLPENKRLKAVLNLTRATRDQRYSLLARADMDTDLHNWARAKENLEIYLQSYPLTRQVATMMANLERTAWHHEDIANDWDRKAIESEDDSLWMCRECGHTAGEWQILCPHCNAFDTLYNK